MADVQNESSAKSKVNNEAAAQNKALTPEEKREARRKRRVRNQVLVYMFVILLIVLLAVGICFAVYKLTNEDKPKPSESVESSVVTEETSEPETEESIEESSAEESIEESEPVAELTHEEKLSQLVEETLAGMTLEDKVAGLFIVTPEAITGVSVATKAGNGTKEALEKYPVGGIIYFAQNIKKEDQFKEMVDNTRLYAKYEMFLTLDEEGGKVARLGNAGLGEKVPSAKEIGETGDYDAALQMGVTLGNNLSKFGLNLDLAPVADVVTVEKSLIADRSFGADAEKVGSLASGVAQGLSSVGVNSCAKHFPGMGSAVQDPHLGLSSTDKSEEAFRADELKAFEQVINSGVAMVMVSNTSAPGLTGNNDPCVFSEKLVTDILRNELGFDGIIITDAMNMAAVSDYYGADEAAIMSLRAGCDMILMPEDFEKAYNGVLTEIGNGTISEERIDNALRRILSVKLDYKVK